jgi:ketosteroid isomerase-like protein
MIVAEEMRMSRRSLIVAVSGLAMLVGLGVGGARAEKKDRRSKQQKDEKTAAAILGLERAALDRWAKGDPSGFLELSADDVVYFDPVLEKRIDGRAALTKYYEAVRGKVKLDRYELVDPKVQRKGKMAVLTFNFVSWSGEKQSRWNCTEVYRHDASGWRIIQTHWSPTQTVK